MSELFPERIETERLDLVRLCREELPTRELYEHVRVGAPGIEAVTEYVTWDPHRSMDETREFLVATERAWERGESATYALRTPAGEPRAGEFVGVGNLEVDWDRRTGILGTWLRRPFWGRGYSGERAAALVDLAFERLDLELVAVTHDVENENSRRAIEKYVERFGGQRDGTFRNFVVEGDGRVGDAVRYTIAREQYADAVSR